MRQSIEVVIPVHDVERPIERGIRSVLDQQSGLAALGVDLGVTVVWHNLPSGTDGTLPSDLDVHQHVSQLRFSDGVKSAAGPRNFALAQSQAKYLSFLDSDDYLEAGSLEAWWAAAEANNAAAVVAPLRTPEGSILASPRIRPSKPLVLDAVRDGLAYRTVPYGLLRRAALEAIGFRYAEGLRTGEDIEAALRLWFRSDVVCYPYGAPAYHQTDDSGDSRVTSSLAPLGDEFQWLERLMGYDWLQKAPLSQRRAIALKLLRVHGIGALLRRADYQPLPGTGPVWNAKERQYWSAMTDRLFRFAGGGLPALSRRDAALTREAAMAGDISELRTAVAHHQSAGRKGDLLTESPFAVFARDSVLRHYIQERRRARTGVFKGH